uniref:Uncharacterized protein n=1 Tax=viral metagenome TaxID=1070528 RepID=A0A6M3L2X9_9ZZZZ
MNTLYTVQKCRLKDVIFYGPIHGSDDGNITICGMSVNEEYYIINNTFDGEITCIKCLDILSIKTLPERAKGRVKG